MTINHKTVLFYILIFLAFFTPYVLGPLVEGDSLLYVNSIEVLRTGIAPAGFIPMMIISTPLGLAFIMLLNVSTSDLAVSWLILNATLYIGMGLFFYTLLRRFFQSEEVAFLGALFLATNYAALSFGLAFMMDVGGWFAYIAALYFAYRYLEAGETRFLLFASASIGLGGLYKEYAFVAYVVLLGAILFRDRGQVFKKFTQVLTTGLIASTPFLLSNVYSFFVFDHYTYYDWFLHNQHSYTYQNRWIEFVKSFGSIYNFAWPLFIGGFYLLLKRSKNLFEDKQALFIWLCLLSCLSVLLWPVVTRVLFITMPAVVLVSCLLVEKMKRRLAIILPVLILYILSSYFMDAYILDMVNLPF
jgi:hypothetical protein